MTFDVYELPKAKTDKRHILKWLLGRSAQGSRAWLKSYDDTLVTLSQNADAFGEALENKDCPHLDVKQTFFKTRRGRVYRVLYFIHGADVYVLRVRGPGQAPVEPEEFRLVHGTWSVARYFGLWYTDSISRLAT